VGFGVVWNRDWEAMPQVVDDAPPAHRYFSAGFPTYAQLMYSGEHAIAPGKSETFSVEGDNAELRHYLDCGIIWTAALSGLRHYLARLGRRSRCFSRCLWALTRAVALFVYAWNRRHVYAWNRRQWAKRAFPKLPAEVCDFVADLL